jgi:hypothetical protein
MTHSFHRREFLRLCGQFGVGLACGCAATELSAEETKPTAPKKLPELKTRAYCGLICGKGCELWNATLTENTVAKEKIYKESKWKEKYGVEFKADVVFCHGCKAPGKPTNVAHKACTVLKCNLEHGFESCLQCQKLAGCDKTLWKDFPKFKEQMIKLQQRYVATEGFKLA